jgi:hypothetical protein
LGGCGGIYQNEGEQKAKTPSRCLRASIVFRATRSMTKSPSSGRSKPRAVLELIPCCRCGVLFPKTNGRKEKRFCSNECRAEELRFCSKHCQGQHVVETRQLVGRHLNVPPLPPDEMAFVIDDGGRHRLSAPRKMHIDDQRVLTVPVSDDRIQSLAVGGAEKNASKH